MKTDNSTIIDKALDWYSKLDIREKFDIIRKIHPDFTGQVTDELKVKMYELEHPTETIKEVADLSTGFTGGENGYDQLKAENASLLQRVKELEDAAIIDMAFSPVKELEKRNKELVEALEEIINEDNCPHSWSLNYWRLFTNKAKQALQNNQTVK